MSCDYATYVVFSQFTKFKSFDKVFALTRRGHTSVSHPAEKAGAIRYVENDVAQFTYLHDYFADKSPLTMQDIQNHKDMRLFNIAVKFNDYQMAKLLLKQNPAIKTAKRQFLYKIKIFCASNKFLFCVWKFSSRLCAKL
jgi:hypothetical protein